MKVAKNTMFVDGMEHIQTMHIPYRDLKPSIRNDLKAEGLYALEQVFDVECDGHGCGMDGCEDISFTLESSHKKNPRNHAFSFEIEDNGKKLEISERIHLFSHKDISVGDELRMEEALDTQSVTISKSLVMILKRVLIKKA